MNKTICFIHRRHNVCIRFNLDMIVGQFLKIDPQKGCPIKKIGQPFKLKPGDYSKKAL